MRLSNVTFAVAACGAVLVLLAWPGRVAAQAGPGSAPVAATPSAEPSEAATAFSFLRYRADYEVKPDFTSSEVDEYEVLVKTQAGVESWSQVRLSYSEKMEALTVEQAYTLSTDGTRHDVPADKIYTQESYSSAQAAMYADRKVRVIVFPNLAPGTRLVYRYRREQRQPFFPGYFGLWETFSLFTQFEDARVTLTAPRDLPLHVASRQVQGGRQVRLKDGRRQWSWTYSNRQPLPNQPWTAAAWEYSPTILASTYPDYAAMGRAYQRSAGPAAQVTPKVRAQAEAITAGIGDRREQARAIYQWVARNIRYVAVYLGNGGLEPNPADSILASRYGDCKDHTVILEALLAAKGIASSPVLIGAGGGPSLPEVAVLGRFNHAITYLPEFDLYLDSTSPYARFGQLPAGDLGAPVVHAADGALARTPDNGPAMSASAFEGVFDFSADGGLEGRTRLDSGATGEITLRETFSRLTGQNRRRIEDALMASAGFDGVGRLELQGRPDDLDAPFNYSFQFRANDYVDFGVVGGMTLPEPPGVDSMRELAASASSDRNLTPFYCTDGRREEIYRLSFPASVPVVAIPKPSSFETAAGRYTVDWTREGRTVTARHVLETRAIHGPQALCQPQDYAAFRALYRQVLRGFRGQVVYGDLRTVQTQAAP